MRSFFVQIFLSFWVTLVATFIVTTVISPNKSHPPPDDLQTALQSSMDQLALFEIEHSSTVCSETARAHFFLLDSTARDLCATAPSEAILQLAARAQSHRQRQFSEIGSDLATAQPVLARNGQAYTAVLLTPRRNRPWFPHLPSAAIPISALVTFVFAYLLTNPVRALRTAFRRFAAGDMSIRLPVSRSALRDWGGADIRTLMIDFNEMADRIQALLQAHKTLLRDVSHELRSPLARLNVALELAREDAGEATEALDRAELESSRLNALIGELLSLSLMETIQDVPNRKPVSLENPIERLMPDLSFEADARGCRIIHKQRGGYHVLGSEDLLRRAVENVVRNAIRFSPSGAQIMLETLQEDNKSVVRVYDSGPGVPEESLEAIFRPFYRVDTARQSTTGGFGVGLAIAERAIQLHSGTIRAFNKQDGGLCVEIAFPCDNSSEKHFQQS